MRGVQSDYRQNRTAGRFHVRARWCPVVAAALLLLLALPVAAQTPNPPPDPDTTDIMTPVDTADTPATFDPEVDSLGRDSIRVGVSPSGRDEHIVYSADSIIFSLDGKKAYLYGNADVKTGEDRLRAAYIEIDFERSELFASVYIDPETGEEIGIPVLNYAGEELSALTLKYNFETGRGVSTAAEIAIEEGFLHVERFKRVSPDVVFAENGRFTTCDAPHPHYYFEADRMKLQSEETIFADRLQLYIQDVPVISLPVAFFFALGGGRHSGILIPSVRQSDARGFELQGLGYYYIINDYADTKFTADLSARGGYNFNNLSRFRLRGKITVSDLQTRLSFTRDNVDDPYSRIFSIGYSHNQTFGRGTTLSGNLFYTTATDPFRKTTVEVEPGTVGEIDNGTDGNDRDLFDDVTQRDVNSNISFSSTISPFGIDLPYTLSYSRRLDIVTGEVKPEEYIAQVSPRPWTPFARSGPDLLNTLTLRVSPRYKRSFTRTDTLPGGGFANVHTAQGISLSPSVSLNPKFGYFTVTPSLSTNSSIFFRRLQKQPNASGGIDTTYYNGLYAPFWYSWGLDVSTNLYAVIQPRIFGINAIRHRLSPRIGIDITPDFSDPTYGYYDEFFNPRTGQVEKYSIFAADASVALVPGQRQSRSLTWGLDNSFEAKIAQGDTLEDRKITLLNLRVNGSYNLADSLKPFGNIFASANTNLGKVGNFTANATLTPYRRDTIDPLTERTPANQRGIPLEFPWVRFTDATFTFNTTISQEGFETREFISEPIDSLGVRRHRFDDRENFFEPAKFYGTDIDGDGDFRIPWTITLGGTYGLTPFEDSISTTFNLNLTFSLGITPTTTIQGGGYYDVLEGEFNLPRISLLKDLHDWTMRVSYVPSGFAEQFTISIGFKPSLLSDLEQEFRF